MRAAHILCTIPARRPGNEASRSAMTRAADDYATRAAAFRRLAEELKNLDERAALLAIADQYEAVAAKLEADEAGEGEAGPRPR